MIGSAVARAAIRCGHEVHATSRRPAPSLEGLGVTHHPSDILDPDSAAALVAGLRPELLVHCAWETRHGTYWDDPANVDWVVATGILARAFAATGGGRFVQVGSCAEYDWTHGFCIEGVTPERPGSRYGMAKLAAFKAVEAAALGCFEAVEPRIFFAYGPGENENRLIPYICRSLAEGKIPELSSGRQWRDLLFVDDAASAILAVAEADTLTGPVNIGAGIPVALGEVASFLARRAGAEASGLGSRPDRPDDPTVLLPDTTRLFSTGWRPSVSLEDGLARTFEWWAERPPQRLSA